MEKIKDVQEKMLFIGVSANFEDFQLQSSLDKPKQRRNVFKLGEAITLKVCSFRER
ncbi:hypothetical protein [Enterococcus termitis]|uniref:hypothetical protein n=1 Tax=Enterococcus termitis TaxID=332950 RepID=UPI00091B44D0|nr:hypothetical protein [Enterococcus termitis]OJG99208.1 hypothetical protein RV18_GL002362 [Enterococcus termitis]